MLAGRGWKSCRACWSRDWSAAFTVAAWRDPDRKGREPMATDWSKVDQRIRNSF
jgi:hypothetical protein